MSLGERARPGHVLRHRSAALTCANGDRCPNHVGQASLVQMTRHGAVHARFNNSA